MKYVTGVFEHACFPARSAVCKQDSSCQVGPDVMWHQPNRSIAVGRHRDTHHTTRHLMANTACREAPVTVSTLNRLSPRSLPPPPFPLHLPVSFPPLFPRWRAVRVCCTTAMMLVTTS